MRHGLCSASGPESIVRNIRKDDGFTLIDMLFVCGLIGILSVIALPGLLMAKQAAGSASAIGSLRAINSAELTYALTCGGGFYAPNLTTLACRRRQQRGVSSRRTWRPPTTSSRRRATRFNSRARRTRGAPATCNGLAPGSDRAGLQGGRRSGRRPRTRASSRPTRTAQLYETQLDACMRDRRARGAGDRPRASLVQVDDWAQLDVSGPPLDI